MTSHIFQVKFTQKNGPTIFHNLQFSAQSSTEATVNVYRQGPVSSFNTRIQQASKEESQRYQEGKRCQKVEVKDVFEAFKYMECRFEGSQLNKKAMVQKLALPQCVNIFYITLHDHVVNDTIRQGYFCDDKFYYQVIVHLRRPEYYC